MYSAKQKDEKLYEREKKSHKNEKKETTRLICRK